MWKKIITKRDFLNEAIDELRKLPSSKEMGNIPSIYKVIKQQFVDSFIKSGMIRQLAGGEDNTNNAYGEGVYAHITLDSAIRLGQRESYSYGDVVLEMKLLGGYEGFVMYGGNRDIDNLIIKTLKEVAEKYGQPRKSELVGMEETETFVESAVIPDYRLHLMLTRHGYLKKHTMKSLQSAGELKTKDDDEIFMGFECENKSDLLIFTDKCNLYKTHVYDFSDTKPGDLGHYLSSELEMEDGERPIFMISTTDYKGILFIAFENGKAARFPISSYETKQNRKKLINAYFDGSKAIGFMLLDETEDPDLIVTNSLDKAAVFKASLIPLKTTRTTQGVQLLVSKKGSVLRSLARLAEVDVQDPEYYRIRKVPAIGYYIREHSLEAKQVSFDDLK